MIRGVLKTHLLLFIFFIGVMGWNMTVNAQELVPEDEMLLEELDEASEAEFFGDEPLPELDVKEAETPPPGPSEPVGEIELPGDERLVPKDEGYVIVEPTNVLPSDVTGGYYLIPYRIRRKDWGGTFAVGYSTFTPIFYEPDSITADFETVYGAAELPMIDLTFSIKRNFGLGSIGVEVAVGTYQNSSDSPVIIDGGSVDISTSLSLNPVRVGAIYTMDNLFFEPYVAPYVAGGIYTIYYEESQDATSVGGNTGYAPYFFGGLLVQLDWLDQASARESYEEAGIENTFIFLELRKFLASQEAQDPDFETEIHLAGGFRVEF